MKVDSLQAFLAAYDEHADALFRFCYAFGGNRERAKDSVQESFVRVWTHIAKGRRIKNIRPFLYMTARNVMIDEHRKPTADSLELLTQTGFDLADDALDPMVTAEASRAVQLVSRLDPKYRDAVLMRFVGELPPKEIARIIGESENVVSVRINRGLSQLRQLMNI